MEPILPNRTTKGVLAQLRIPMTSEGFYDLTRAAHTIQGPLFVLVHPFHYRPQVEDDTFRGYQSRITQMIELNPGPVLIAVAQAAEGENSSAIDLGRRVASLRGLVSDRTPFLRYFYLTEPGQSTPVRPSKEMLDTAIQRAFKPERIFVCGENLEGEVQGTSDMLTALFPGKVSLLPAYSFETRY